MDFDKLNLRESKLTDEDLVGYTLAATDGYRNMLFASPDGHLFLRKEELEVFYDPYLVTTIYEVIV
jgi:hypothetical protein